MRSLFNRKSRSGEVIFNAARSVVEPLETRRLMSTINWINKGTGPGAGDTDNFNAIFGGNATTARNIVQRGIDDMERIIADFNGFGGRNTYTLTVDAANLAGNVAADTNVTAYDLLLKPTTADITMDVDAAGGGWYFDPTPGIASAPDDSDFTSFVTPFVADRIGTPGRDFYRSFVHELTHAMGISATATRITGAEIDVGDDPNSSDPADRLTVLDADGDLFADYTFTTSGGRHLFEGGIGYVGPIHPNEIINAGRTVSSATARRGLVSDVVATALQEIFDYTIVLPSTLNTFYVNLNRANNSVTVNGDIDADDDDFIDLEESGTAMRFEVNGTSETIEGVEFTNITVNAGEGGDDIDIDQVLSGKNVTINGQNGNDLIQMAPQVGDLDSDIDSDITANGGAGTDTITFNDSGDGAGNDSYIFNSNTLTKGIRTFTYNTVESVRVNNGSPVASTYNIDATSANYALEIVAGGSTDTFNIGNGDYDGNILGDIDIDGLTGAESLTINDDSDTGNDTYTFSPFAFSKSAGGTLTLDSIATVVINGNNDSNLFNIDLLNSSTAVTVNAGGGDDTLDVDGATNDIDNGLLADLNWFGQNGDDLVDLNDSGDSNDPETYNLAFDEFTKSSAAGTLFINGTERYNLVGNNAANTITVEFGDFAAGKSVTVNGGGGNDAITSLNPGTFSLLEGNVTLEGGGGNDAITLFDDIGSLATAYDITSTTVQAIDGGVDGLINYAAENLAINSGNFSSNFRIASTSAATDYVINAGLGDDTFTFGGSARDVSNVLGDVSVNGDGGLDRLQYNDDNFTTASTYTASGNVFGRVGVGNVDPATTELFVLNAGTGGDTINVNETFASLAGTVNGGGGNDTIFAGNGNWDANLGGSVTLNGGGGSDEVSISDSADAGADNYAITATQATKNSGGAPIDYGTIESLRLNANNAANVINVNSTFAGTITVRGNDGTDNINVVDHAAGATVIVDGGLALDNVSVNADNAGVASAQFNVNQDLNLLTIGTGGTARLNTGGLLVDVQNALSQGTLDLTDGGFIDRGGTAIINAYATQLTNGYNGGAWNGAAPAILSTTAAGTTLNDGVGYAGAGQIGAANFMGAAVAANDLLLRYTLNGDANLNHVVNINDFALLAANFNVPGSRWFQGNFNYDAGTDISDFAQLAANFNQSLPTALPRGGGLFSSTRIREEILS